MIQSISYYSSYGLNLNNSYVLSAIGFSSKSSPYDTLWSNAVGNLIISCLGFVPGYYFTVFTIERIGRKKIQLGGFIILTALFIVLSAAFNQLKQIIPLFIALFTLAQFFFNFGPNRLVGMGSEKYNEIVYNILMCF